MTPSTEEQLFARLTKLEHAVDQLARGDPDRIASPADVKAMKAYRRELKAGALVEYDELVRDR